MYLRPRNVPSTIPRLFQGLISRLPQGLISRTPAQEEQGSRVWGIAGQVEHRLCQLNTPWVDRTQLGYVHNVRWTNTATRCAQNSTMCPKMGRSANVVPKTQRCARRRTLCHEPTNQAQEGPTDPSTASYRRACFWGWFWENLGMARDYRPALRDRAFLLPPDMRDWLPEDHF